MIEGNLSDIEDWLWKNGKTRIYDNEWIAFRNDHPHQHCPVCTPKNEDSYWDTVHRRTDFDYNKMYYRMSWESNPKRAA